MATAAARALATGDALGALKRVALCGDAESLALRGIAMAQLGDLGCASDLLRRAARAFGPDEAVARARCVVAQAEIALAVRDLSGPIRLLEAARATLEARGDRVNAAHARHVAIRRLLLIGHLDEAEHALAALDPAPLPPGLQAVHQLIAAGIALRRIRARAAQAALLGARSAARRAGIPALMAEVDSALVALEAPAARLIGHGSERTLGLHQVEALLDSQALVVDACRYRIQAGRRGVALASRPVLFTLARALAEAWPGDASRRALVARAFRLKLDDESQRVRLRVEIARLRRLLRPLVAVRATCGGFRLLPRDGRNVLVLAPPVDGRHMVLSALLADGEMWSSSALALALGVSQRSVQRALETLAARGTAQAVGRGRARRWTAPPVPGFTTALLLSATLSGDAHFSTHAIEQGHA